MFPSIFPLHCRYHARCGKIRGADVRDAGFLVHHPDHLHYDNRAFYSEDPGDLLGVSADVVDQLDYFPCVFPESGLDSQF